MNNRNIIGDNIKKIRKSTNLTQEQLTAKLQVNGLEIDRPMLSKIESKKREVLDYEIKAIAEALMVPIQSLFDKK
ncbi:helix-turn-helix transcriptional regulator [uncultured Clostridium sp.]|uniref:helix-turn-helix domain-containing protein n=1 Tax=uncultured Clostridium sp. TaxID=59620 RepID=UPI00261E0EC5|nr:helix-turn-helix transcriptional regulator [uncultured Clostridium sp.]